MHIGVVYLSPANNKNRDMTKNLLQDLEKDITKFSRKGSVLVLGDFNARTGTSPDYINSEEDYLCYEDGNNYENYTDLNTSNSVKVPVHCNSEDKKSLKRGRELLEICKNIDVSILNGRTRGDLFGKCTCFRWNGYSVVDYALCSATLLKNIVSFQVHDPLLWLSDHCPIEVTIDVNVGNSLN